MNRMQQGRRLLAPMGILCTCFILCTVTARSQTTFTLKDKFATIRKIFDVISSQTKYSYYTENDKGILKHQVTAAFDNFPVQRFLDEKLPSYGLTYTFNPDHTVICIKPAAPAADFDTAAEKLFAYIEGQVFGDSLEFLPDITVNVKGTGKTVTTGKDGKFYFKNVPANATLRFSGANVKPQEVKVTGTKLRAQMEYDVSSLQEAVVYDGYRRRGKGSATGSYKLVSHQMIGRNASSDLSERLEGMAAGVLVPHGSQTSTGSTQPDGMIIRGYSTLYGNTSPLIVVDDFPYDGSMSNINPNDVETVTFLCDASAASIYGVKAANGVVVITTKKWKADQPRFNFMSGVSFQPRPNVFNIDLISGKDFIGLEDSLFHWGHFDASFSSTPDLAPFTPIVWSMHLLSQGRISRQKLDDQIREMQLYDVRKDVQKYLYRNSLGQQLFLQVSGLTKKVNYIASAGLDQDAGNLTGTYYRRITSRAQAAFTLRPHLELYAGLSYMGIVNTNGNNFGSSFLSPVGQKGLYPYARLADEHGRPLPIYPDYNKDVLDQAASAGLQDWTYYPLNDIKEENNKSTIGDLVANLGLHWKIAKWELDIKYQREQVTTSTNDLRTASSYFTRNLRNTYARIDPGTGQVIYIIPAGGISDISHQALTTQQAKVQLSYHKKWNDLHDITIFIGTELRSAITTFDKYRLFGITKNSQPVTLDANSIYNLYLTGEGQSLPVVADSNNTTDHFLSSYLNITYNFDDRYILSASARTDVANLFGASTNGKIAPLGSLGFKWLAYRENKYNIDWLPKLSLRASYGTTGNIARNATGYTTISAPQTYPLWTNYPSSYITGLPNKDLRWEQTQTLNLGLEFTTRKNIISGSFDYYIKHTKGVMAPKYLDPTFGGVQNPGYQVSYYTNSAAMTTHGFDASMTSQNHSGKFQWTTDLLLGYTVTRVTRLSFPAGLGKSHLESNAPNPFPGKPLYAVYAYRFLNLDHTTGDPVGYYNGKPSTEWGRIYDETPLDSMVYVGPAQPTTYGAVINTFKTGGFSLSLKIDFKFNYYMRTPALNYDDLFNKWTGLASYSRRWKIPGDERHTDVPSLNHLAGPERDLFYGYSTLMTSRADNIRLQNICLTYDKNYFQWGNIKLPNLKASLYLSNVGLLWAANKKGLDPYSVNVAKDRIRYAFTLTFSY